MVSNEAYLKQVMGGDFENEIDRLLAEAEYLMNSPVGNLPNRVVNRPPGRPSGRTQGSPEERPQERPPNRPQGAPARPVEKMTNRPPENPASRLQSAPVSRSQNIPANRPQRAPENRLGDTNREGALNDSALSRELLEQMKVLTKEVKLLRAELKSGAGNLEAAPAVERKNKNESKRGTNMPTKEKGKFWWVGEVAFYLVLIAVIAGAFLIKSNSGGRPTLIAGFSGFTVLTSSMEDTIPKGSLVITKAVDPNSLKIGDDITYMSGATSTITHRIIEIQEDYLNTNARAFITKGTMNKNQDKNPVAAANVVGKVVFHSKVLGAIAAFLSKNWPVVLFVVVILAGLFYVLKWIFREEGPDQEQAVLLRDKPQGSRSRFRK